MKRFCTGRGFFLAYAALLGALSLGCAGAQAMVEDTARTVENIAGYTYNAKPEAIEDAIAQMLVARDLSIAQRGLETQGLEQRLIQTEVRGGDPTLDIMHSKIPLPVIKITDRVHYEARITPSGTGGSKVEILRVVNGTSERDLTMEWMLIQRFDPDSAAAIMAGDSMLKMPMDICKFQMRLGAYSSMDECLENLR